MQCLSKGPINRNLTYREINRSDAVENDEDVVVGEILEAVVHAGGEEEGEDLQVEVEGGPRGRLVLGHGGDDGDVVLGVGGVEERVEPAGPGRDFAGEGEDAEADAEDGEHDEEEEAEERLEVLPAHARLQVRDEGHDLAEPEHAE